MNELENKIYNIFETIWKQIICGYTKNKIHD